MFNLQQDQVDSVEYYALQATEHVGYGGTQLLKGSVSRTKARSVTYTHTLSIRRRRILCFYYVDTSVFRFYLRY